MDLKINASGFLDMSVKVIERIANRNIEKFFHDGFAEAGCNGPYGDHDTAVRNTAHWCVTFSFLYYYTGKQEYRKVIEIFSEYLLMEKHYGSSGAAICRTNHFNDDTNGVIGQAWLIEGLLACYDILKDSQFLERAVSVWKSQKYNPSTNSFGICCSDGKVPCADYTYNHNLWFAASGAMIVSVRQDNEISRIVREFVKNTPKVLGIQPSGKLYHRNKEKQTLKGNIRFVLNILQTEYNIGNYKNMNYLESGYQLFDLFGFALLKLYWNDNLLFRHSGLNRAIKLGTSEKFISTLKEDFPNINKYGFPYNSPAFEYPFVAEVLGGGCDEKLASSLLQYQMDMMEKHPEVIHDMNTLTARIYELSRFCSLKCEG